MATEVTNNFQRNPDFTFIWTIENSSALLHSETVQSPRFIAQPIEETKWILKLRRGVLEILEFEVRREDDDESDSIEIDFELSELDDDGSPLRTDRKKARFTSADYCFLSLQYKDINDISFRRRPEFLLNDTLTIRCRMWRTGTEIPQTDTCFARTRMGLDHRSFIWAIQEFSCLQPGQERTYILNPTLKGSQQLVLNLYLSKFGESFLNIDIHRNSEANNHGIFCKISLLDNDGRVEYSRESYLNPREFLRQDKIIFFLQFFERDKIMNKQSSLLQNDVLYLRCEFQIGVDPVWSRIENYTHLNLEEKGPETAEISEIYPGEPIAVGCPFKIAFEGWYKYKRLCDVQLRTGTASFPAHKIVLGARSPIFEDMFSRETRRTKRKIVDIPDLNADILRRLLLYIYKDTLEELPWESAMDLYEAAIKYQLLGLRKKCSVFLQSVVSVTNVCSIILLADMHKDSDLIKAAEYFISAHDNDVFDSDEWKNFKEENVKFALEITERIIRLSKRTRL